MIKVSSSPFHQLVDSWSKKFNSDKYPTDFYLYALDGVRAAEDEEQLRLHIVRLLHWKDGKVRLNAEGEIKLGGVAYLLRSTKPNTYSSDAHDIKLGSRAFYDWSKSIRTSECFSIDHIVAIKERFGLWPGTSIVLPIFILHALNPRVFPIFDQNVERARRFFAALPYNRSSADLGIENYLDYRQFWLEMVNGLGMDASQTDYSLLKLLDDAMWAIGKHLKLRTTVDTEAEKQISSIGNVISPKFKNRVLSLIQETPSVTQKQAMQRTAQDFCVQLPLSYLRYPGSHIDRWRRQGYPKQLK
jgi:hypothetical protein